MRLAAWIRTGLRMSVFLYMYTTVRALVPSNSASNSQVSSQSCIMLRARVSFAIIASPDNSTAAWLAQKHTRCGEQGDCCLSGLGHSGDVAETSVMVQNVNLNRSNLLFTVPKDTHVLPNMDALCMTKTNDSLRTWK